MILLETVNSFNLTVLYKGQYITLTMSPMNNPSDWTKVFSSCIERTKASITKKLQIPESQLKQVETTRASLCVKVPDVRQKMNIAREKRLTTETQVNQAEQSLIAYETELRKVSFVFITHISTRYKP